MSRTSSHPLFDAAVVAEADRVADLALRDLLGGTGRPRGVVATAPAGAGKSFLVSNGVALARSRGLRVAVAAPTNEQAFGLVRTIATRHCTGNPGRAVTFVPASTVSLPGMIRVLPGVREAKAKDASHHDLIVGTLSKLGDAFARGDLDLFDVLLIDEAYQADSAGYFAVGGLAPIHFLVGDAGQISPFATVADPTRWRGLPEDPLQTAVGILCRNHPSTPVHRMPVTRRLDPRSVSVARLFYPDLPFGAAVLPGVRELQMGKGSVADVRLDRVLDLAAREGWAHAELPTATALQADPEAAVLMADLVGRLFDRCPLVRCEREPVPTALIPKRVAVGVSHNDQRVFLRAALDDRGLQDVVVETANKLQGLEFDVVFVWHPLAGLSEADGFHLDPGRMCVLLTRHRQACVVVGRGSDRALLEDQLPPPTAAYLGWEPDPVLDGWEVHGGVFAALEAYRLEV